MPARASTKPQLPASLILDARELIAIWRARDPAEWSRSPERYRLLGEKVLRAGEPLLAYDLVSEGLGQFPGDVRLRQLQGLALARSGANTRASEVLAQSRREKHADEETLGMLARTYKDGADRAASAPARRALLQRAADTYEEAYRLSRGIWTGINAATTALLIGKRARAHSLAKEVQAACRKQLAARRTDKFWLFATLGEAALVLRQRRDADEWYARAGHIGGRRFGDLQSSRRNARLT